MSSQKPGANRNGAKQGKGPVPRPTKTTEETIAIGIQNLVVAFANLLPRLSKEEFETLKESIKESGIMVPILVTKDRLVLDGYHRLLAAQELGLTAVPVEVIEDANEDEWRKKALAANLHRRHLSRDDKRELIAEELKRDWEQFDRPIARLFAVDHKTVGSVRTELEENGEIPQREKRKSKDPSRASASRKAEPTDDQEKVPHQSSDVDEPVVIDWAAEAERPSRN